MKKLVFIGCFIFFTILNASNVEKVLNTKSIVWGMDFLDDKKLILSFKSGQIALLDLNTKKLKVIKQLNNLYTKGQGGLLDIKVSPNFKKDKTIFFTYVKNEKDIGLTTLAKATFENDSLQELKDILVTNSYSSTTRHFGNRIAFDNKNYLYFSIGDRGIRNNSQNLRTHSGKILRLNLDGTIPLSNPFIKNKNALAEIYSYGHRNPQGLFYDKKREVLFSNEHGPKGGDEINIIKKASNYGWPIVSYGKEYWAPIQVGEGNSKEGVAEPIVVFTPSIAPSSLLVYNGKKFKEFEGYLFSSALIMTHLNLIKIDNDFKIIEEKRVFEELKERIRSLVQNSKGDLYFSTDNGNIYKVLSLKN
ncbi:PQQ-dependent sugar dehydrogenase [Malaciobacter mytili]|uniref:PQQ-dependent sugar dehydrogenase n=1 Tax=Malaciobacter mytili TaxID=603050 RepID=UPI003A8597E7